MYFFNFFRNQLDSIQSVIIASEIRTCDCWTQPCVKNAEAAIPCQNGGFEYFRGGRDKNFQDWGLSILGVLLLHPKSLGTTLEIFHFPEAVQVFLNATPITYSSINSHWNKNQPPLVFIIFKYSTHTNWYHPNSGRSEKKLSSPRFTQENPQLSPHHLIPNQHQK